MLCYTDIIMRALIIGGAGYIGSVTAHLFTDANHEVVVLDNLSTGHKTNLPEGAVFIEGDVTDIGSLRHAFEDKDFDVVLHFAAKIRADESLKKPKLYIDTNCGGVTNALEVTTKFGVENYIFSSSAAVYGDPGVFPIGEDTPIAPINPYGTSKAMAELACKSYGLGKGINWLALRYFNAAGTYKHIGPDKLYSSQLIPAIIRAARNNEVFKIFKNTDSSGDGSCTRDFVHVADIARAHLLAAEKMVEKKQKLNRSINLGCGTEVSVLDVAKSLEKVGNVTVKYELVASRPGDPARSVASTKMASDQLGWSTEYDLTKILEDAWLWSLRAKTV